MEGETSRISAPILLLVEFFLALLLAVYLLYKYGNFRRHNPFVTGCTLLVWFLSFVIIFLLPVDVSSAFYTLCLENDCTVDHSLEIELLSNGTQNITSYNYSGYECANSRSPELISILTHIPDACPKCFQPYTFVCSLPLKILWNIIYWLYFVLSWIVLPLGQSYVLASYFSIWKKLLRAAVENAIFYVTFLIIFIVLFIYLVVVKQIIALKNLPFLLATASNTWGLLILTVLLGYGLVEVPRSLWDATRRIHTLNHCYFKAAKLYTDLAEADDGMKEVIGRVEQVSQIIHYNDSLRKYVDIIIKKFSAEQQKEFSRGYDDYEDFQRSSQDLLTKTGLEGLLKKTMKSIRLFNSSRIQWLALTDQTMELEDIQTNSTSHLRRFQSSIRSSGVKWYNSILEKLEWYWKLWVCPWVYRVGAVLLAILSVLIIWCEVTFGIQVHIQFNLSIFALLVYALHDYGNYIAVEALSIGIVAYLSICAYFTVFRIRIFNLYHLAPHHSTDEYSLLFSAMLLSRLALPICLNYLYVIHVVGLQQQVNVTSTPKTAFANATGNTDLIPWLTSYFYIYYPMLILLVCLLTILSLGTRLASLLGYQKFIGEDDFSADYIDEGKILMKRERRIRERNLREGKNRDQLPFQFLRASSISTSNRREHVMGHFSSRLSERGSSSSSRDHTPLHEDDSGFKRFLGQMKMYTIKSKGALYLASKVAYIRGGGNDKDDVVELLPPRATMSSRSGAGGSSLDTVTQPNGNSCDAAAIGRTRKNLREPPKALFDDI